MKTLIHSSETRGHADLGWLNSFHSFSFANYYNPERMSFGALRVLNDDTVAAGRGFGTHPHSNMEIISIPLEGDLQHTDDMGNATLIKQGDIQVMSAGTGVSHSEFNHNKFDEVKFLQIWIHPNKLAVTPRYDQISMERIETKNSLYQILSPNPNDDGVWIYQDAWFHLGNYDAGKNDSYTFKKDGNGAYIFLLEGEIEINGLHLFKRDGYAIWETGAFTFKTRTKAKVLIMEIPMSI